MVRAGLIRKLSAGIYNYLPLGLKVIRKVENIIREEMNGIRCETFQWRLYGTLETNQQWRTNPLGQWLPIKDSVPNRYQAALAQGALCDLASQVKSFSKVMQSLDPNNFTGLIAIPK
ncbi:MAG: hypothetical protein EB024_06245 [Burkholderiaceae bacterium]|nr:hypothetical protein [Burkholderiaceae bacterium]